MQGPDSGDRSSAAPAPTPSAAVDSREYGIGGGHTPSDGPTTDVAGEAEDYEPPGPRLACDLPIEREGVFVHNELTLSGWALSPVGVGSIVVQVDDRLLHASYGLDSPWLAESIADFEGADRAAYRLQIDTSSWAPGRRRVTIAAYDQEGRRSELTGSVEVVPFAPPAYTLDDNRTAIQAGDIAMWLERPSPTGEPPSAMSPVEIAGWAYARDGIDAVLVTIDGQTRAEALQPVFRPELLEDFGVEIARQAGFVLRLDSGECPPGWHHLSVVATAAGRTPVGLELDFECLPEPTPPDLPPPGEAMPIDWQPEPRPVPHLRPPEEEDAVTGGELAMWRDRALLAEADAAASRNQANTARMHQEATLHDVRAERLELAALRQQIAERNRDIAEQHARHSHEIEQLSTRLDEQSARATDAETALTALTDSLSWNLTKPLRAVKRAFRRGR